MPASYFLRLLLSAACMRRKMMISKVTDTNKIEKLFADWQESIIWSCIQKVMGNIYADSLDAPKSAMAILGDFCFFAGEPSPELIQFKPDDCTQEFIIMVPQSEEWAEVIVDVYGSRSKKVTRYATKKETDVFDKNKLQTIVDDMNPLYDMKMMDEEIFKYCKANGWSKDLISQYADYATYEKLGIGVMILKDGEPVAGASAYSRYEQGIEIEIDTKEEYRRKGLAYACGAKLILECLKKGLYPSWDAQNKESLALAEKLGYHYAYDYTAFEIFAY